MGFEGGVYTREGDGPGGGGAVPGVVVGLNVVCVFEAELLVKHEQREEAERRAAVDHGLVAAEEGYGVDACWCGVVGWGGGVEVCYHSLSWYIYPEILIRKSAAWSLIEREKVFTMNWSLPAEALYAGKHSYGVNELTPSSSPPRSAKLISDASSASPAAKLFALLTALSAIHVQIFFGVLNP
jgi:hypothetical protein